MICKVGDRNNLNKESLFNVELQKRKNDLIKAMTEGFGLNEYEAKVYSALVFNGPMGSPNISEKSGVPLQRVYQTITSLIQKGFILSAGLKPKRYTAQNPQVMFSRKYEKIREIIAKSEEAYEVALFHPESYIKGPIWNLKTAEDVLSKVADLFRRAKKTVTGTSHDFSWIDQMGMNITIESALKRGVRIQGIGFADPTQYPDTILKLRGESFELRRYHRKLPTFMIADSSEVVFAIQKPSANLIAYYSGVWMRDKLWADFFEECFRYYWQKSLEF